MPEEPDFDKVAGDSGGLLNFRIVRLDTAPCMFVLVLNPNLQKDRGAIIQGLFCTRIMVLV